MAQPTAEERLWAKVDRSGGPDACWPWTGYVSKDGYGQLRYHGRAGYAHRLAYELTFGSIAAGKELDHDCHTRDRSCHPKGREPCVHRRCCNPVHLIAVTHQQNVERGRGQSVRNALKTHCPQGHEYTPENIYWARRKNGRRRICRTCQLARSERNRRRRGVKPVV